MRATFVLLSLAYVSVFVISETVNAQEEISPAGRRIVGGEKTDISRHPWQVALNVKIGGQMYLCGGAIIADRWVLTAAHCFEPSTKPEDVRAKAGATEYASSGAWLDVARVVIHEKYNKNSNENDIALIRLRSRPQGRVIPLATTARAPSVGLQLEVTGWGDTREDGQDPSRVLMKADVPYVDNTTCNTPDAYNGRIKAGMLCAGYRDGGIDACQGDSGGPLVWRSNDGPVLVGVVSWGDGCARELRYGVYTRVTSYGDWIRNIIRRTGN